MKRFLTADDLPVLNMILSFDAEMADHILGKIDAVKAAMGPTVVTPPAGSKRPIDVTPPGPGEQPDPVDRENHRRIVEYLREYGPSGPAAVKKALNLTDGEWARGLTGVPAIHAEGKGAGRKYLVVVLPKGK